MVAEHPIRTPWRERFRDFRSGPLTVVVWLVAMAAALILLAGRASEYEYVGLARTIEYEVSAVSVGRVASLPVSLYEPVDAGQVVALLDDSALRTRLATAAAELERLDGALAAEAARNTVHAADVSGELRRFQVDEQQLTLELLALQVEIESDRIELERLELSVERAWRLHQVGLIAEADLDDARLQHDAMAKRVEENEILLARTKEELHRLSQRRASFESRFSAADEADPLLRPLQDAIRVQTQRIRELEGERKALVLRTPVTGCVRQVLARTGQAVVPGEPVVVVAETVASEVLAYLPETGDSDPRPQDRVLVSHLGRPNTVVEAMIDRIGPSVEQLPQRLWRDPAVPEYGLPVVVSGIAALGMIPGERVTISVPDSQRSP